MDSDFENADFLVALTEKVLQDAVFYVKCGPSFLSVFLTFFKVQWFSFENQQSPIYDMK